MGLWDEIDELREMGNLQEASNIVGLQESAIWDEIYELLGDRERRIIADRLGVSENATAEEVDAVKKER